MSGDITDRPVILFDGECNLCHGAVRFILRRNPMPGFMFSPLGSEYARRIIRERGGQAPSADSILLLDRGELYRRSDAVLRIAGRLRFPWPALVVLRVVPRPLRDAVYDFVARKRSRWFGRMDECPAPAPEVRNRFLA